MMKSVDITSILILAYLLAFLLFFEKFVAQDDFFYKTKTKQTQRKKSFPWVRLQVIWSKHRGNLQSKGHRSHVIVLLIQEVS